MNAIKNGKPVGSISLEVSADTYKLAAKCRAISKHLGALAEDLECIDKQEDSEAKACKVIELLNELSDRDLGQIADYARGLAEDRKP